MKKWSCKQHFVEVKWRLYYIGLTWFLTWMTSYALAYSILSVISKPLEKAYGLKEGWEFHLILTDITEGLVSNIWVALLCSFYGVWFAGLWHVYAFIKPGLYAYEYKYWKIGVKVMFMLTGIGLCVGYYLILPAVCNFFMNAGVSPELVSELVGPEIQLEAKVLTYVKFVTKILLLSHIFFQLPCIVFIILILWSENKIKGGKALTGMARDREWEKALYVRLWGKARKSFYFSLFILTLIFIYDLVSFVLILVFVFGFFELALFGLLAYKTWCGGRGH